MSYRNELLTDKQITILKNMRDINKKIVRPVEIGEMSGYDYISAPRWACAGLKWLVHYKLVKRVKRGGYTILPEGLYYLKHFC